MLLRSLNFQFHLYFLSELSRMAEQLPETERSKAVQSGVNLFYEILTSLNLDCRQFPPSCQFLTSCVQILGQVRKRGVNFA